TSEETFAETALLAPKELAALVPVPNRLLRDATEVGALDRALRDDLAEVLALKMDWAFLVGTGANTPTGIQNVSGKTAAPAARRAARARRLAARSCSSRAPPRRATHNRHRRQDDAARSV